MSVIIRCCTRSIHGPRSPTKLKRFLQSGLYHMDKMRSIRTNHDLSVLLLVAVWIVPSFWLLQIMLYKHSYHIFYVCICWVSINDTNAFDFRTYCQTAFQNGCAALHSSVGCEHSCCLKPLPNTCVGVPLILAIVIRMWFNLHFLTTTEVEHLFT